MPNIYNQTSHWNNIKAANLFTWSDVHKLGRHYEQYIEEWWDSDLFPWGAVNVLITYCPQHFSLWWQRDRFPWRPRPVRLMIRHLGHRLTEWWDRDRFPWEACTGYLICKLGTLFPLWWSPEYFPWKGVWNGRTASELLTMYCPDYLPDWYDPDRLMWTQDLCKLLIRHCREYQDIWGTDTLLYKLSL